MNIRFKIICLLLSILAALPIATGNEVDVAVENLWAKIDKAVANENWDKADSLIVETLTQHPDEATRAMLLSNLGMIRYYAGKDSLAVATLTQAHHEAPAAVAILANRAKVLTSMGHVAAAVADYDQIEQLDSTYSDTYLYRGLIYLYNGYFEDALSDLKKREKMSPESEDTLIALASYYTITEDYESAAPYYTELIHDNAQAEYYAGRAMCALHLNRLYDAAEDIAEGLALDPNYSELYICRAILNKRRYCPDDAQSDAERAISLGASPARVNALLGF